MFFLHEIFRFLLLQGLILAATTCTWISAVIAQNHDLKIRDVNFSYGLGFYETVLPEGFAYNPTFLIASLSIWKKGRIEAYSEWQFATLKKTVQEKADYESGINAGLKYSLPINPFISIKLAGGVGPHFITARTERQAPGFIFSDNIEAGVYVNPSNRAWKFNFTGRFRHISNAGLKRPNGGINNGFLLVGVSKSL